MAMVRMKLSDLPPLTEQDLRELRELSQRPDSEIDFSDIPELDDEFWKNAKRGVHYRPLKQQVTTRIDADVLAWLKSQGKGYQSRLNAILREAFDRERATRENLDRARAKEQV